MSLKLKREGRFLDLAEVKAIEKHNRSERIVNLQLYKAGKLAKAGRTDEAIAALKRAIEEMHF